MEKADCVILAAGDFPSSPLALKALREADYLCCCDGAAKELIESGLRQPDAIVGDGDSLPEDLQKRYAAIFHHVSEQEDNDLTKATRHCLALGFRRICYLGITGRREDHSLGNLSLMLRYKREFHVEPQVITNHGRFFIGEGETTFATTKGQQVSIFNLTCRTLTGTGLRWPLRAFTQLWQGTLNEATGSEVQISGDGEYAVYQVFSAEPAL